VSGRGLYSLSPWERIGVRASLVDTPGESKQKEVRYLDIHEDDRLDEEFVASWIRQALELPGETCF